MNENTEPKYIGSIAFPDGSVERYESVDALFAAYRDSIHKTTEEFITESGDAEFDYDKLKSPDIVDSELLSNAEYRELYNDINFERNDMLTEVLNAREAAEELTKSGVVMEREAAEQILEGQTESGFEVFDASIINGAVEEYSKSGVVMEREVAEQILEGQTESGFEVFDASTVTPQSANVPFEQNEHISDLLKIFRENGMESDAKGLAEIVGLFTAMEKDIGKTVSELGAMRKELSAMRDEQKHIVVVPSADGFELTLRAEKIRPYQPRRARRIFEGGRNRHDNNYRA